MLGGTDRGSLLAPSPLAGEGGGEGGLASGALFLTLAVALLGGLLPGTASGQTGPTIELTGGSETVLEEGRDPIKFSYTARNNAYQIAILVKPRGGATITDVSIYEQATAPGQGDTPISAWRSSASYPFYYFVHQPTAVETERTSTFWIMASAEDPPEREDGEGVEVSFLLFGRHAVTNQFIPQILESNVATFTLADPPSVPEAPTGVVRRRATAKCG